MCIYFVALNIIPRNACVENYRNKNSIISYLRLFLLLSTQLNRFLQLKRTNKNARNNIYEIQNYFSQPVQSAGHTTLLYFYED